MTNVVETIVATSAPGAQLIDSDARTAVLLANLDTQATLLVCDVSSMPASRSVQIGRAHV